MLIKPGYLGFLLCFEILFEITSAYCGILKEGIKGIAGLGSHSDVGKAKYLDNR